MTPPAAISLHPDQFTDDNVMAPEDLRRISTLEVSVAIQTARLDALESKLGGLDRKLDGISQDLKPISSAVAGLNGASKLGYLLIGLAGVAIAFVKLFL